MNLPTIVGEIGVCPIQAQWEARRTKFREIEFSEFGSEGFGQHAQSLAVTYELEHIFCSGAWLGVIVFAYALVEMYLVEQGGTDPKKREDILAQHPLKGKIDWLRKRRNALVHADKKGKAAVSFGDQLFGRDQLYQDAKQALAIAFRYTLEPSRQGDENAA